TRNGLGDRGRVGAIGKDHAVGGGIEAARLDEAGGRQTSLIDQGGRGQGEAGQRRHGSYDAADPELAVANANLIPDADGEALGEIGAEGDLMACRAMARAQVQPPRQRPAAVDTAELSELRAPARESGW